VLVFGAPLYVYARIAIPLVVHRSETLRSDALCYVRRALYLSQGDFYHSISGYWSPLISWCMAPLMWWGVDGAYAAWGVLCAWGALLVVAIGWLLYTCTSLNPVWKLGVMMVAALAACPPAAAALAPDLIMSACVIAYLAAVMRPTLMERWGSQFLVGVLGGVAYLAKAYALPFVVVHLPLTLAMRGWAEGKPTDCGPRALRAVGRRVLGAYGVAMVGLALTAGPWIGVLSWRYGGLTISTTASRAHAVVGPGGGHPLPAFFVAEDPYISAWENPEDLPYKFWSPLASREHFSHQMRVMRANAAEIGIAISDFAWGSAAWVGLGLGLLLALGLGERGERWKSWWLLATLGIYCGGFLPVFFTSRYIWSVGIELTLVLGMKGAMEGWPAKGSGLRAWVFRVVGWLLAMGILAGYWGRADQEIRELAGTQKTGVYRQVAGVITKQKLKGPIASTDGLKGSFVAMYAGEKIAGFPRETDVDALDRKLREAKVGILLIWGRSRFQTRGNVDLAMELVKRPTWKCVYARRSGSAQVYVPVE